MSAPVPEPWSCSATTNVLGWSRSRHEITEDTEATEEIVARCCYVATTRINSGETELLALGLKRLQEATCERTSALHPRGVTPRGWAHLAGAADPSPAKRDQDFPCGLRRP